MKGILGKKVGMTQVFTERGEAVPVTVIEAGPCWVTQVRTPRRDGYTAFQFGFEEVDAKRGMRSMTRTERGHLKAVCPLRPCRAFNADGGCHA